MTGPATASTTSSGCMRGSSWPTPIRWRTPARRCAGCWAAGSGWHGRRTGGSTAATTRACTARGRCGRCRDPAPGGGWAERWAGTRPRAGRRGGRGGRALARALQLFTQLGDVHGSGLAQRNLAYLDRMRGDTDAALRRDEQALLALREAGDAIGEAHALNNIAQIHLERHEYEEAERLLADALELARVAGARRVEAQIVHRLGESLLRAGDLEGAREAFESVLVLVRTLGDPLGEGDCLHGLGLVPAP